MKYPPCGDCNWRLGKRIDPNCHDTCERYLRWREERRAGQRHRNEYDEYVADVMRRRKRGQL